MSEMTTHRSLKEKQRFERENLILQVAEEVLLEKGYHETAMDEIAARVGIAKGTLYLHFARKEDLLVALIERKLQTFRATVESISSGEGTAQDKLVAILHIMYMDLLSSHYRMVYSLYNSSEIPQLLHEKRTRVGEIFSHIAGHISSLFEEGKVAGDFDPSIPTEVMVSIFFSLLSPQGYKRLVVEGSMLPEALTDYIERFFFRGIKK